MYLLGQGWQTNGKRTNSGTLQNNLGTLVVIDETVYLIVWLWN